MSYVEPEDQGCACVGCVLFFLSILVLLLGLLVILKFLWRVLLT